MIKKDDVREKVNAASGKIPSDLVLKNGKIFNVFTKELEEKDLAVKNGEIVGIGEYSGANEVDLEGKVVLPGFIDGHIHIESSMLTPPAFSQAVVPHGTTAVITDPHEITNVAGLDGVRFMISQSKKCPMDIFFMLPSCVPATAMDESGAVLDASDLSSYIDNKHVIGLAELMDFYGTVDGADPILDKVVMTENADKKIDGHAPFLEGNKLNAYVTAGVQSDHECSNADEAKEKLKRGQWIMIREGTAAQNLEALMPLFESPFNERILLVTDDKHPGDLIDKGHIDYIIKKAVSLGAKPEDVIVAATKNAADCFGLEKRGALAPGYIADLVIVDDIDNLKVQEVYKDGKLVAKDGQVIEPVKIPKQKKKKYLRIYHSFNLDPLTEDMIQVPSEGSWYRIAQLVPGELLTEERIEPWVENEGVAKGVDINKDIIKGAVFERHHRSGHVGVGFLGGYGLKRGAVATSIAHDSHNLISAGTNDADIILAANTVRDNNGGLAAVLDGEVIGELKLPIGGLMTEEDVRTVSEQLEDLKSKLYQLGVEEGIDPFMTLGFTSLPVIPKLRINTLGLIDTDLQQVVPVRFDKENE